MGSVAQARTYPDLLASPYDEELFEYYTTSQLVLVTVQSHPPVSACACPVSACSSNHHIRPLCCPSQDLH